MHRYSTMKVESQCSGIVKSFEESSKLRRKLEITAVGDGMVGKTCMLITYMTQELYFAQYCGPTVLNVYERNLDMDGQQYNLWLWDTGGHDYYNNHRTVYYREVDCFLLCYSVGSRSSFENVVNKWHPEIQYHCPKIPVILIGTKTDLRLSQNDCITRKKGKKMMKKIGAVKYLECSAVTNEGLDILFTESVIEAIERPRKNHTVFPFIQCCK